MIWLRNCPNDWGAIRPLMTASGRVVLMCDEADEVWLHPDDIDNDDAVIYASPPDWTVTDGVSIAPGTTRWATEQDLAELDWDVEWRRPEPGAPTPSADPVGTAHASGIAGAPRGTELLAAMTQTVRRMVPALPSTLHVAVRKAEQRWLEGAPDSSHEGWDRMVSRFIAEKLERDGSLDDLEGTAMQALDAVIWVEVPSDAELDELAATFETLVARYDAWLTDSA